MDEEFDTSTIVTTHVSNMSSIFSGSNFNRDISSWDTSNVTSMQFMFNSADLSTADISTWDVSSVTNMFGMFSYA